MRTRGERMEREYDLGTQEPRVEKQQKSEQAEDGSFWMSQKLYDFTRHHDYRIFAINPKQKPPRQRNGMNPLTDDVISFDSSVPPYIMILAFCHRHTALCGKVHGHHKHTANKINSIAAHNYTL